MLVSKIEQTYPKLWVNSRRWSRRPKAPICRSSLLYKPKSSWNRRLASFDLAADHDELLSKEQVLGDQGCAGRDEGQDEVEQEAKKAEVGKYRAAGMADLGQAAAQNDEPHRVVAHLYLSEAGKGVEVELWPCTHADPCPTAGDVVDGRVHVPLALELRMLVLPGDPPAAVH